MNYQDADALCRRGGKADGEKVDARTIANNTRVLRCTSVVPCGTDPHFHIRLHKTDILTYWEDGRVRYDTGGWLTMTTRERMNRFGPDGLNVRSDYEHRSGRWLVDEGRWGGLGEPWSFIDGITFRRLPNGWALVPGTGLAVTEREREDRHNKRISKLISRYVDELPSVAGLVNICGNVDAFGTAVRMCALCLTKVDKPKLPPRPGSSALDSYAFTLIGDAMGDMQHLIEHMIDRHYHKGMVLAALTYCGYPRPVDLAAMDRDSRMTKRALRKYLRARLTVGAVATANGRRPIDAKPWNLAAEMAG